MFLWSYHHLVLQITSRYVSIWQCFYETAQKPGGATLTLPDCECGGVDQKQQDVVEKALEQRGVGVVIIRQVFAGQANPTDEQW